MIAFNNSAQSLTALTISSIFIVKQSPITKLVLSNR